MKENEFYSVKLKKRINIPASQVRKVVKNNRKFLVGKYVIDGKTYEAWKITK